MPTWVGLTRDLSFDCSQLSAWTYKRAQFNTCQPMLAALQALCQAEDWSPNVGLPRQRASLLMDILPGRRVPLSQSPKGTRQELPGLPCPCISVPGASLDFAV